ncbi:hypothetical protein [Streptomyces sp. NPDC014894]|uniref:hypothetical protein n=1 Tax=unclassified Streptomyces TaxID=2593676 RepID=UPI0036FE6157
MAARTPTPSRAEGGVGMRLPWWGLALPALAFLFLLVLIAEPAQAQARTAEAEPGLGVLVEYFRHLLLR